MDGLIELDERNGGNTIKKYQLGGKSDCVISIGEFKMGIPLREFLDLIGGSNLTPEVSIDRDIHGFTVINSVKAIMSLSSMDYLKIYGWSSERALIFTDVKFGRSPMIAIRAHPLKPALVVYHQPENVDKLAMKLAMLEGTPLVRTEMDLEELVGTLENLD